MQNFLIICQYFIGIKRKKNKREKFACKIAGNFLHVKLVLVADVVLKLLLLLITAENKSLTVAVAVARMLSTSTAKVAMLQL